MKNGRIRVLLVEDQDAFADLLQEILAAYGGGQFEIQRAAHLQEIIARVCQGTFDVILLDLTLPDCQGLDTYLRTKAAAPSVPVIVLTGMDDEQLAYEAVRQGAQDYLVKGQFDGRLLCRILRYAIERTRAAEALRRSEEFFRLISENVNDMIAVIDRDGRRIYNSPSYRRTFGEIEPAAGSNSFEEIHPDDRERVRGIFQDTVKTGVGQRAEFRLLLRNNGVRHIESQGSVICDEAGRPDKVVVVSRDITERKETVETLRQALLELHDSHEALKTTQLQLVQSEKLAAVSTFAAGVAHEVKNPLQAIILGVDYLANNVAGEDSNIRMVLSEMDQAVQRADAIIRGLLEFTAHNRRDVRQESLNNVVEDSLRSVEQELANADVRVQPRLASVLPSLALDVKTMKHVFINLFLHSARAMPAGGRIQVVTSARTLDTDLAGLPFRAGDTLVAAEIEQWPHDPASADFAASAAAPRPVPKTAVGMIVLRRIVELHGGSIRVVERDDGASRISILFKTGRKP